MTGTDNYDKLSPKVVPGGPAPHTSRPVPPPGQPAPHPSRRPRPLRAAAICALAVALPLPPVLALASAPAGASPLPGAPRCEIFPADNVWNTDISTLPVDVHSPEWLASMDAGSTNLHPDFGPSFGAQPVPYDWVPAGTPHAENAVVPPDPASYRVPAAH